MVHLGKMTLTDCQLRDRQCSFNLSLWRVRITLVAVGKQQCVSRWTNTFDYSLPRVGIETRQKCSFNRSPVIHVLTTDCPLYKTRFVPRREQCSQLSHNRRCDITCRRILRSSTSPPTVAISSAFVATDCRRQQ